MERLPPPVDQSGPRPGPGQRGSGGDGGATRMLVSSLSHVESARGDASTAASSGRGDNAGHSSVQTTFRIVRRVRGAGSSSNGRGALGGNGGGGSGETGAETGTGSVYRVIAPEGIRVRRGADPQSVEVTVLPEGTEIMVAEEVHDGNGGVWMRLSAPREGWIGRRSNSLVVLSRPSEDQSSAAGGSSGRGGGGPGGPDGDWNETGEGAEIALAKELEDCMEEEVGSDLYRRDDRLFGSRQGWSLPSGGATGLNIGVGGRRSDGVADSRVPGERRAAVIGHASVSGSWAAIASMSMAATKDKLAATAATLAVLHCRKILLTVLLQCHREVTRTSRGGQTATDALLSQRVAALLGARDSSSMSSSSRPSSSSNISRGSGDGTPVRTSPATLRTRVAARQLSSFLQLILFRGWRPTWWPPASVIDCSEEIIDDGDEDEDDERSCLDGREPMSERFRSLPVILTPLVSCLIRAAAAQRTSSGATSSGADSSSNVSGRTASVSRGLSFGAQVEESLLQSIATQLRQATRIGHRDQVWASADTVEMTDAHSLRYPRLRFVTWAARVVQAGSGAPTVPRRIFHAWAAGLKSPSLPVKQQVCAELSRLLDHAMQDVDRARRACISMAASSADAANAVQVTDAAKETAVAQRATAIRRLRQCVQLLPLERLRSLAERRMLKEGEDEPMLSRVLHAIVDLVASSELAWRIVRECEAEEEEEMQKSRLEGAAVVCSPDAAGSVHEGGGREGMVDKDGGRAVLCFPTPSAYVALQGRDIEPPWTAEFWILRPNVDGTWEDVDGCGASPRDDHEVNHSSNGDGGNVAHSLKSSENTAHGPSSVPRRGLNKSYSERIPSTASVLLPSIARATSTPMSSVDLSQLPPADPKEGAPTLFRARSADAVGQDDVSVGVPPSQDQTGGGENAPVIDLTARVEEEGHAVVSATDFPPLPSVGGRIANQSKSSASMGSGGDTSSRKSDSAWGSNRQAPFRGAFVWSEETSAMSSQRSRPSPWWEAKASGHSAGRSGMGSGTDVGEAISPIDAGGGERQGVGEEQPTNAAPGAESESLRKGEMGTEPAEFLMSSQAGHIKIQAGGTMFSPSVSQFPSFVCEDRDERGAGAIGLDEDQRPIHSEALCVSIGATNEKERAFDFVVPTGRWVHLAIVASPSSEGRTTLFVDGEPIDTISWRMPLPMGCLGAGPHAQEAATAAPAGGGSFVGLLAQAR